MIRVETIPAWLRWILILPAGMAGYYLVSLITVLNSYGFAYLGSFTKVLLRFLTDLLGPMAFVVTAAIMAPSNKILVSLVMSGLILVVGGGSLGILLILGNQFSRPAWMIIVGTVLSIIGAITGFYQIYRIEKEAEE